jgi:hypothetical protein
MLGQFNRCGARNKFYIIGWDDIDLDYHTFELARNCLEAEGFTGDEYKTSKWYEELVFSF